MEWNRLRERHLAKDFRGGTMEVLKVIADQAGLKLEVSDSPHRSDKLWMKHARYFLDSHNGRKSLLQALNEVLSQRTDGYDVLFLDSYFSFILEPGKIRIVSDPEFLQFWNRWWEREFLKEK